jgi:hypothetical protein
VTRIVVHTCNPRYSGGRDRRTADQGQPQAKSIRPYLKNILKAKKAGAMAQVVEDLPTE